MKIFIFVFLLQNMDELIFLEFVCFKSVISICLAQFVRLNDKLSLLSPEVKVPPIPPPYSPLTSLWRYPPPSTPVVLDMFSLALGILRYTLKGNIGL